MHIAQLQRDNSIGRRCYVHPARPVSWHLGARFSQGFIHEVYGGEQALGNTIDGLEHLAVSNDGPLAVNSSATPQHPNLPLSTDYGLPDPCFGPPFYVPAYPVSGDYNTNPSSAYLNTQTFPGSGQPTHKINPSYFTTGYNITNPEDQADDIYTHTAASPMSKRQEKDHKGCAHAPVVSPTPRARTKQSRDLIGMGLYDDTAKVQRESVGKTLKLEDPWQPPEHTEGDERKVEGGQDEEDSTDEEDEELPPMPATSELPSQVPVYQDLSNQSFFFDNDDSYRNMMAVGPELSFCQPKVPDPMQAAFSWI